jgi:hypothetical protein
LKQANGDLVVQEEDTQISADIAYACAAYLRERDAATAAADAAGLPEAVERAPRRVTEATTELRSVEVARAEAKKAKKRAAKRAREARGRAAAAVATAGSVRLDGALALAKQGDD